MVWIASRSLTDGEVTTSLSLARFRKLQTAVLLEEDHLEHFSSQFPWLKANQVGVAATVAEFFRFSPSYVLVDNKVAAISVPLDGVINTNRSITVSILNNPNAAKDFISVFKSQYLASYKRIDDQKFNLSYLKRSLRENDAFHEKWKGFEAYRYSKKAEEKPEEIAKKLPKTTKFQEKKDNNSLRRAE